MEELSAMDDRPTSVVASRPAAKIVPTRDGQADQAYRDFLDNISLVRPFPRNFRLSAG